MTWCRVTPAFNFLSRRPLEGNEASQDAAVPAIPCFPDLWGHHHPHNYSIETFEGLGAIPADCGFGDSLFGEGGQLWRIYSPPDYTASVERECKGDSIARSSAETVIKLPETQRCRFLGASSQPGFNP